MNYTFANRVSGVEGSLITGILGSGGADLISFSRGNPSAESFPAAKTAALIAEIFEKNPISVLQYSVSEGYRPLREAIADRLNGKYNFGCEADHILICSGAQQTADLIGKILINEGDTVICEDPSFVGCLNAFRSYGAKLAGIPMESDGPNLARLEAVLENTPNVKLMYLIPTFQNPSGITMSAEKRRAIYALASRYGVPIFEDNPYGDLRFTGEDIPPIRQMDTEGLVIYAGSFSKVMAPAFRVGYMVVPPALMDKLIVGKQVSDVHTNILFQHVAHRLLTEFDFEGHLERLRAIYRERAELMLAEMEKHFSPKVTFTHPEGGLFIMAFLPEGCDSMPFCQEGVRRGVAAVPGIAFAADMNGVSNAFRLNFSAPTKEQIVKGIEILGKLTYDYLA